MSPSAPELSVYREEEGGGGETRGDVTFWGITEKMAMEIRGDHCWGSGQRPQDPSRSWEKKSGDHVILWSSVNKKKEREKQVISRYQKERTRRTNDLPRLQRKKEEKRWSSQIKTKSYEDRWSSEITKQRTRRAGNLPKSGRKIEENRWYSEIRKKEHKEQVTFRDQEERTRRTGDLLRSGRKNTENRWSFSRSGRNNEENRWSSEIRKKERGEQVIFGE